MPFGKGRSSGGAGKASLARMLWRSLESLPSREQIERLIAREVARAERNGLHFSLCLFRVRKGGRLGLGERRLAVTLLRRSRLTDEVGWFDDHHLCALLPDTSAAGAQIFADAVCDLVSRKGPRPIATIYSYPFDWVDRDDEADQDAPRTDRRGGDRRGGDRRGNDSTPPGGGRGGRHEPATSRPGTRGGSLNERLGLGNLVGEDEPTRNGHANGNGHKPHGNGHNGNGHNGNGHANGGAHDGPAMNRGVGLADDSGGLAVLEAPPARPAVARAVVPVAAATGADAPVPHEVKHIHELLVRPMPFWKRALDVVGAVSILTAASPVLAVAAVAIKLSSKGPVVFKQRRAGLGGRPFTIYKFRTMCNDAEAQKKALRKFSEQDGPAFKMARDPRITGIGHVLRKTSLDELPQLFNVLKGDMSLVGPRPLPLDEQAGAEHWQQRRLDVTPGLTCIWQIKGRSTVTFAEWVRMDVEYMRRRTVFHDLAILFKTVPAVLLRRGAR